VILHAGTAPWKAGGNAEPAWGLRYPCVLEPTMLSPVAPLQWLAGWVWR
jgi:hypothetical protein